MNFEHKVLSRDQLSTSLSLFLRAGGSGGKLKLEEFIMIVPFVPLTVVIAVH